MEDWGDKHKHDLREPMSQHHATHQAGEQMDAPSLEEAYAIHHFRATYKPVLALYGCFLLAAGVLVIVDPNALPMSVAIGAGVSLILWLRVWAHHSANQARALSAYSCVVASLVVVIQISQLALASGVESSVHIIAMTCEAMIRLLFMIFVKTTIMLPAARNVIALSFLLFSALLPPISELGWPAEPALTSSAVICGLFIGHSLDSARWRAFVSQRRRTPNTRVGPHLAKELPTSGYIHSSFANAAQEEAYAVHHFRATYGTTLALSGCFCLAAAVLVIVDASAMSLGLTISMTFCLTAPLRVWAHLTENQTTALFVHAWLCSGVHVLVYSVLCVVQWNGPMITVSLLAFGMDAMLRLLFMIYIQVMIMQPAARNFISLFFLVFCALFPPISQLGWPAEPAVTCSAAIFGYVIGHSLDYARRLAFAAQQQAAAELESHGHEIRMGMAGCAPLLAEATHPRLSMSTLAHSRSRGHVCRDAF